jgi:hypothetical protein
MGDVTCGETERERGEIEGKFVPPTDFRGKQLADCITMQVTELHSGLQDAVQNAVSKSFDSVRNNRCSVQRLTTVLGAATCCFNTVTYGATTVAPGRLLTGFMNGVRRRCILQCCRPASADTRLCLSPRPCSVVCVLWQSLIPYPPSYTLYAFRRHYLCMPNT